MSGRRTAMVTLSNRASWASCNACTNAAPVRLSKQHDNPQAVVHAPQDLRRLAREITPDRNQSTKPQIQEQTPHRTHAKAFFDVSGRSRFHCRCLGHIAKPRLGATGTGFLRSARGGVLSLVPPSELRQLAEQARNRDHDSNDPYGQTRKQYEVSQEHRHVAPPLNLPARSHPDIPSSALVSIPDVGTITNHFTPVRPQTSKCSRRI